MKEAWEHRDGSGTVFWSQIIGKVKCNNVYELLNTGPSNFYVVNKQKLEIHVFFYLHSRFRMNVLCEHSSDFLNLTSIILYMDLLKNHNHSLIKVF